MLRLLPRSHAPLLPGHDCGGGRQGQEVGLPAAQLCGLRAQHGGGRRAAVQVGAGWKGAGTGVWKVGEVWERGVGVVKKCVCVGGEVRVRWGRVWGAGDVWGRMCEVREGVLGGQDGALELDWRARTGSSSNSKCNGS